MLFFISEKSTSNRDKCKEILSAYYSGRDVLFVPSSRDAIYELLIRLPQKKVVIPAYTCMVVNEAVSLAGKEAVYSPTDVDTYNSSFLESIDSDCIVLATHQYGLPCSIIDVAKKCKEVGAILIEDCATSMGSKVRGKLTGTFGDYAVISFNSSKTLTVPPFGGVIISSDKNMLQQIDNTAEWRDSYLRFKMKGMLRGLAFVIAKNSFFYRIMHWLTIERKGKIQRTEHEEVSSYKTPFYLCRFSEWQAYILLRQLKSLTAIIKKRQEIFEYYDSHIIGGMITKPILNKEAVCTRYAVKIENRLSFYKECLKNGIDMDFSHCNIGCPSNYKNEHLMSSMVLNLPYYYNLSKKEMEKVVEVINSIQKNK